MFFFPRSSPSRAPRHSALYSNSRRIIFRFVRTPFLFGEPERPFTPRSYISDRFPILFRRISRTRDPPPPCHPSASRDYSRAVYSSYTCVVDFVSPKLLTARGRVWSLFTSSAFLKQRHCRATSTLSWFQVKVLLAQVGYIKSNTVDEAQLQDVIMDIVTGAIRSTDVAVDLYRWPEFPNFTKSPPPVTTSPLDSYTDRMVGLAEATGLWSISRWAG